MSFTWDQERESALKTLYADELSMSQIARAMVRNFGEGCTRNAVIGKLHRMGFRRGHAERVTPKRQRQRRGNGGAIMARITARAEAAVIEEIRPREVLADLSHKCSFMGLVKSSCRWPIGEVGDPGFFFCGNPEADFDGGRPYCWFHRDVAAGGYGNPAGAPSVSP